MAAITPAQGYDSYFAIGRESTWKTPVAATHKFKVYELEVVANLNTYTSRTLAGGTIGMAASALNQGVQSYDIRVVMSLSYDFMGNFFDSVQGVTAFGTPTAPTGAGPYTYTWIEKTALQSFTIETIEGARGLAGVTNTCNRFAGCKVKLMKIHGEAVPDQNSNVSVEMTFVAPVLSSTTFTPSVITNFCTDTPTYFYHATTVDDGTTDAFVADGTTNIIMKSFDLTIDPNTLDRYMMGLSSKFEPQRQGNVNVEFSCVKELQTSRLWTDATSFSTGSPKLVFDNGLAAGNNRQWTFDMGTAKISAYGNPITQPGIIEQNVTWKALYDSGNTSALKVINVAGQATLSVAA